MIYFQLLTSIFQNQEPFVDQRIREYLSVNFIQLLISLAQQFVLLE